MTCTPTGAKQSDLIGNAAVLGNEGSGWLQLDSGSPGRPGVATGTCHKLCGGVRGVSGVPRAVIRTAFLTISKNHFVPPTHATSPLPAGCTSL